MEIFAMFISLAFFARWIIMYLYTL